MIATELTRLVDRARTDPTFRADKRTDIATLPSYGLIVMMMNPIFRADLAVDLAGTLRRNGFNLGDEEIAALRRVPLHLSEAQLILKARSSDSGDKVW